jgi:hypothetical protein
MFFSRWSSRSTRRTRTFRPELLRLEDRTVPSAAPGTATHLLVVVPPSAHSGQTFDVFVEALTASNQLATAYNGNVTLSLGTPDSGATLPGAWQFSASDHGYHDFKVTLAAQGGQTIKAADKATPPHTASASMTVTAPAVPNTVLVLAPQQTATGVATAVTVQVEDQYGNVIPNFAGTVTFLSTDSMTTVTATPGATPSPLAGFSYTFTAPNNGWHTFNFNFGTGAAAGTATTLTSNVSSGGMLLPSTSVSLNVYPATMVTHFGFVASSASFLGTNVPVTLQALNAANQVVAGFTGTVTFSSTDTKAKVSATQGGTGSSLTTFTYTFTAADAGQHTFGLTYGTAGVQTLTVTDRGDNLASTVNVLVAVRPPKKKPTPFAV